MFGYRLEQSIDGIIFDETRWRSYILATYGTFKNLQISVNVKWWRRAEVSAVLTLTLVKSDSSHHRENQSFYVSLICYNSKSMLAFRNLNRYRSASQATLKDGNIDIECLLLVEVLLFGKQTSASTCLWEWRKEAVLNKMKNDALRVLISIWGLCNPDLTKQAVQLCLKIHARRPGGHRYECAHLQPDTYNKGPLDTENSPFSILSAI